jgi:hypothetical protein
MRNFWFADKRAGTGSGLRRTGGGCALARLVSGKPPGWSRE